MRVETKTGGGNRPLMLYLHIPFCVQKCLYCDFLSAPADDLVREKYLVALRKEAKARSGEAFGRSISSVFFGGGTPSLLSGEQVERLICTLRDCYDIEPDAEITMEANPGTVDAEKLLAYRRAGVNRLSFGLQSADNSELSSIGRIHTWEDFVQSFQLAREAGFANLNVDLMSTLPGQTFASYLRTLEKVLALPLPPEHISAYSLILEPGTPLAGKVDSGEIKMPDEDLDRALYHETERILQEAGYERYEISNYAKKGFACRHNCGYWTRREYLGLGIGAASFLNEARFRNADSLQDYMEHPTGCRTEKESLSREDEMEEFFFLGLRMTDGVSCLEFETLFGFSAEAIYGEVISQNLADGLLVREGDRLRPTKKGLDLNNYLCAQFLLD